MTYPFHGKYYFIVEETKAQRARKCCLQSHSFISFSQTVQSSGQIRKVASLKPEGGMLAAFQCPHLSGMASLDNKTNVVPLYLAATGF